MLRADSELDPYMFLFVLELKPSCELGVKPIGVKSISPHYFKDHNQKLINKHIGSLDFGFTEMSKKMNLDQKEVFQIEVKLYVNI